MLLRRGALLLGAGVLAGLAAGPAPGHPTRAERERAAEERRLCSREMAAEEDLDPAHVGMEEAELRALFAPGTLRAVTSDGEAGPAPSGEAPRRLERPGSGDLAVVRYDLWKGHVYRILWRLAPRFERPVLDALERRARTCFGRPRLDQTFAAEPGSPAATYRRIVWHHGERRIELRQLHPLRGGPVHLIVSSRPRVRSMREAGVPPPALPETTGPWWSRGAAPVVPADPDEAEALGRSFLALLAHADH